MWGNLQIQKINKIDYITFSIFPFIPHTSGASQTTE